MIKQKILAVRHLNRDYTWKKIAQSAERSCRKAEQKQLHNYLTSQAAVRTTKRCEQLKGVIYYD